jgi:hypothetical protein
MKKVIPGSNVARVVGLLWDNLDDMAHECYTDSAPYFNESCFDALDDMVRQATDAGLWVILTCRSKYGAGQDYQSNPMHDVFHNSTLRSMMFTMWKHVVAHYSSWDYIAAYEIMSEPRDKDVSAQVVHDFYAEGCAAVHSVDPATPCMVGPRSYYKLYAFTDDVLLANDSNVIYTVDYFDPDEYVFGKGSLATYPAAYRCHELYKGWTSEACPGSDYHKSVNFDITWHEHNFATWAGNFKSKHNVPVFVNQWGVVHGVTEQQGRFEYMKDVAQTLKSMDIGWAWWTFRGGGEDWAHGSMEFVFEHANGTLEIDEKAVAAVLPYMDGKSDPIVV